MEAEHELLVVNLHWPIRKPLARARPASPQMMTWSSRAVNRGDALGNQAVLDAGHSLTTLCLLGFVTPCLCGLTSRPELLADYMHIPTLVTSFPQVQTVIEKSVFMS